VAAFLVSFINVKAKTVDTVRYENFYLSAGGDYSIDFSAGDPSNYPIFLPGDISNPPIPPGRANSPIIDASSKGSPGTGVESLTPEDMALGQIVPFEFRISVGTPPVCPTDGGDCITIVAEFRTRTTSGGDFGYDPTYGALAAFVDAGDPNASGDTDANVTSLNSTLIDIGSNKEAIQVTFEVCGLDPADGEVVVEVWMVLKNSIGPSVTGNVQSYLIDATTSGTGDCAPEANDNISTGNQTVPLLQVGQFFSSDVDVSVTKSDIEPGCMGDQIIYTLVVSNAGPSVANSIVITDILDPNVAFVSSTLPCIGAHDGSMNGGIVTCDIGPLAVGASKTYSIIVDILPGAPTASTETDDCGLGGDILNNVSVSTISDDINSLNDIQLFQLSA